VTDSNIAVGVVLLLGINVILAAACYIALRTGWKIKN